MTAAQGAGLSGEELLSQIISRHAPHGFNGVMRGPDQGCPTYLLATRAQDELARRERTAVAAALTTAVEAIEAAASEAARSWGDDAMWLTTGTNVAEVSSDYFAETVRDLIPQEES